MKNYINFSENGSAFSFVFSDNSDSVFCRSKERGLKIVMELSDNKRITTSEYSKIRNQIMKEKNLPWCEPEEKISIFSQDVLDQIKELLPNLSQEDDLEDIATFLIEPFTKVCLKMCAHDKNYGRIYFKNGCTGKIDRKIDALSHLVHLKKENLINDEEFIAIQKDIAQSSFR